MKHASNTLIPLQRWCKWLNTEVWFAGMDSIPFTQQLFVAGLLIVLELRLEEEKKPQRFIFPLACSFSLLLFLGPEWLCWHASSRAAEPSSHWACGLFWKWSLRRCCIDTSRLKCYERESRVAACRQEESEPATLWRINAHYVFDIHCPPLRSHMHQTHTVWTCDLSDVSCRASGPLPVDEYTSQTQKETRNNYIFRAIYQLLINYREFKKITTTLYKTLYKSFIPLWW